MNTKNIFKRVLKSSARKIQRVLKNRVVQNGLFASYHVYCVTRVIRNPFILLEQVNLFNMARLLKM